MHNKQKITEQVLSVARKIKLLLMDCDGVLTDGRLYYSASGEELKVFNVKDGQGIFSFHDAGFQTGIISGRDSLAVKKRAEELGMSFVKLGSGDKVRDFYDILDVMKISAEEVAFVGDDIADIDLLKIVGFSIGVADSVQEVLDVVNYITVCNGGCGAIREVTDLLLKLKVDKEN